MRVLNGNNAVLLSPDNQGGDGDLIESADKLVNIGGDDVLRRLFQGVAASGQIKEIRVPANPLRCNPGRYRENSFKKETCAKFRRREVHEKARDGIAYGSDKKRPCLRVACAVDENQPNNVEARLLVLAAEVGQYRHTTAKGVPHQDDPLQTEPAMNATTKRACWEPAEKEVKLPKYESWPGYAQNLQFGLRRYCALWGRGT